MTDRRRSRFTFETLAKLLEIDSNIVHIQTDHARGIIEVFFQGDGSFAVAEGEESMVRSPQDWRRAELEQELKNGYRIRHRNFISD